MMDSSKFSVTQVNAYIKQCLETDPVLQDIWIVGEITNLKCYALGEQIYFNLSDGQSCINCVVYGTFFKNIGFKLENGLTVIARGKIKTFQKKGTYTFQIAYLTKSGQGDQSKSIEALKKKLVAEGLFDPDHKVSIPLYCQRIGLLTAPDSAAMWDFISIARSQAPHLIFYIIPSVVQGPGCAGSVMSGIEMAERFGELDVLVLLRGGGSAEDLAGFNDEALVRRVFACSIPVISAIGHEVDYTLVDFVADYRAATPTAAAQLVVAPYAKLREGLIKIVTYVGEKVRGICESRRDQLMMILSDFERGLDQKITSEKVLVDRLLDRLALTNPLHKLQQGYSIARLLSTREVLTSITQIRSDDSVITTLKDGQFQSKVEKKL